MNSDFVIYYRNGKYIWSQIELLSKDSQFTNVTSDISRSIRKWKSDNSNRLYDASFHKFRFWCVQHGISYLPGSVSTVAVFPIKLVQQAVSESMLFAYFHSIKWYHDFNICENPRDLIILHMLMEGGKIILSKPIKKRNPITTEIWKRSWIKIDKVNE